MDVHHHGHIDGNLQGPLTLVDVDGSAAEVIWHLILAPDFKLLHIFSMIAVLPVSSNVPRSTVGVGVSVSFCRISFEISYIRRFTFPSFRGSRFLYQRFGESDQRLFAGGKQRLPKGN